MKTRYLATIEILFIIVLACVPLFATFPYRVNIFLSWEGAYRLSQGQLPFRDFGTPLGGMYWAIPAIFFKIFGPQMISLVKAQVFLNIIAGLSFRSIFKSLSVQSGVRLIAVILFCISYSFFNFWPWYNHSVIVYELVALAFLFKYIYSVHPYRLSWLIASALFVCFSFLTKQDGGGMAFMICLALLAYNCFRERRWLPLFIYLASFTIVLSCFIFLVSSSSFGYWFNHGQAPHSSRVSLFEIAEEFFANSQWIKFYLLLIVLLLVLSWKTWKELWNDKTAMLFLLLTVFMLGEAAIFQVTSYTPPDNNIFFHSFAFVFILSLIAQLWPLNFNSPRIVLIAMLGVLLWWSGSYWKYIQRIAAHVLPAEEKAISSTGENIVNKKTYMIRSDTTDIPMDKWTYTGLKSFHKIYMPQPTVDGIHRLLDMDMVKQHKALGDLRVLNMSELTPLAIEIPYQLERDPHYPLWYHLGVGMFNRQAELFEKRVREHYYDLVLFEYIPALNNFYPFRVRDVLKSEYKLVDSFMAPRRGDTKGNIEIYVK